MQVSGTNPLWLLMRTGSNSPGTVNNGSGDATPSGGTSQTGTAAPSTTTEPTAPPRNAEAVQPTTAATPSGSATASAAEPPKEPGRRPAAERYEEKPQPRAGSDALRQFTNQAAAGGFRPAAPAGMIDREVRRIEATESASITKAELIKQASVALLAQANLRRQDVVEILLS